ncbi:alpha/beta fold hydrolase [Nocardia sp. NPDC004722]
MWTTTDSVVSADGTRIVFHTVGAGPPLVIVHGALVSMEMYRQLAELLATDYRVVLVGRRDYAPSENSTGPHTFARQAQDLAAVLEHLDGPSFVFGHSAGGLVTLEALAAGIPNIRRFALYEAPLTFAGGPLVPTLQRVRELVADQPADAVMEFLTAISDSPIPDRILRAMGAALATRATGLVADLECLAAMDPDVTRWTGTTTPALLLAGSASDRYGLESMAKLDAALPDSRLTVLEGLFHHPDDFTPVAAALREFFGPGTDSA